MGLGPRNQTKLGLRAQEGHSSFAGKDRLKGNALERRRAAEKRGNMFAGAGHLSEESHD